MKKKLMGIALSTVMAMSSFSCVYADDAVISDIVQEEVAEENATEIEEQETQFEETAEQETAQENVQEVAEETTVAEEPTVQESVAEGATETAVIADTATVNIENKDARIVESGKCGDNVTYTLDSDGVLTISGSGDMYTYDWGTSPFYHNTSITRVVIENGVTSTGRGAFSGCSSLTSVTIPNSVTSIVFLGCNPLKVYCVQGSAADNYTDYPYGSTKIYGTMPTTETTTEATTLAPIPDNLSGWVFDKDIYKNNNSDVVSALGSDEKVLYKHWLNNGIATGRTSSPVYNPNEYLEYNSDVKAVFGNDYVAVYNHFINKTV